MSSEIDNSSPAPSSSAATPGPGTRLVNALRLNFVRIPGWLPEWLVLALALAALTAFAATGYVGVDPKFPQSPPHDLLAGAHPHALPLYSFYCVLALTLLIYMLRGHHSRRRWFIGMLLVTVPSMLILGVVLLNPSDPAQVIADLVQTIRQIFGLGGPGPRPKPPTPEQERHIYALLNTAFNTLLLLAFLADTSWRWRKRVLAYRTRVKAYKEATTRATSQSVTTPAPVQTATNMVEPELHWREILAGDCFAGAILTGLLSLGYRREIYPNRLFDYCQAAVPVPGKSCTLPGGTSEDWPTLTFLDSRLFLVLLAAGILLMLLAALATGFGRLGLPEIHDPSPQAAQAVQAPGPGPRRSSAREVLGQTADVFGLMLQALFAHAQLDPDIEGLIVSMIRGLRIFIVAALTLVAVAALALAGIVNHYYIALVTYDHTQEGNWLLSVFHAPANLPWLVATVLFVTLAFTFLVLAGCVLMSLSADNVNVWLGRTGLVGALVFEVFWVGALFLAIVNILLQDVVPPVFSPLDASVYLSFVFFLAVLLLTRRPAPGNTPVPNTAA